MSSRRESRVSETSELEEGKDKISDLANEARQTHATNSGFLGFIRRLHMPLLLLAPSLLIGMLAVLLVPVCYSLITTGNTNTKELSDNLLVTMMKSTELGIRSSLEPLKRGVNIVGAADQIAKPITVDRANIYNNLVNQKELIKFLATVQKTGGTDSWTCYSPKWLSGYGPEDPINSTTISWVFLLPSRTPIPPYKDVVIGLTDDTLAPKAQQYALNQTTYEIIGPLNTADPAPFAYDVSWSKVIRNILKPPNGTVPTDNFMSITTDKTGYMAISMAKIYLSSYTGTYYGCAATLGLSSTWSAILEQQKITDETVIAVLDDKLNLVASSSRVGAWKGVGAVDFSNETFSPLLVTFVKDKYASIANVPLRIETYMDQIDAKRDWMILVTKIQFTNYPDDIMVLISATPREYIFGKIDKAAKRAMALSIGLGVGIVIVVSALFVAVTMPLSRLGNAMQLLTKLDFAALEQGRILEIDSHISEVRRIQATFGTMVKAFAGGIKKNREMIARTVMSGGGTSSPSQRPSMK
ncbi:uncharacterized protein SPPG_08025 [Spizellomyces punctatus DAOM BR117]|uniref:Uncharacterized protein n=1 Tax=Spizellomyces punctatus (strain DAOM BR117) TaxID=645134 RepID=A0A0L0H695_SPIPD|nr:uncharacterized protein SPPG_08025 [Spizellomyces punctatus DAOM BR117]KNC96431.1 hypothetical protein SPPG_08025 [Spizellomyces punctatus DAOM BR117]|eukprot:XP_016604471.1 hypothetical protein SPPG_08025 [Spizellomyces punctatus DAOM BR117]